MFSVLLHVINLTVKPEIENHRKGRTFVTRHEAVLQMIRLAGGMSKAGESLGYTRDALSNRVYGRKGQQLPEDDILELQILSGQALYAEAFAAESGGVFIRLPEVDVFGNDELLTKFQQLQMHLGELSKTFIAATADGMVDRKEKKELDAIADDIHKTLSELMAITYRIYCP